MEIKTTQQFIQLIAPAVIENCKRHGWGVPSAIIAQACLESMKSTGWSGLASTCYNFWGMKWNKKYGCSYKEYVSPEQNPDGTYINKVSKFNKYPTIDGIGGGIDGYFVFIEKNPRYKKVMQCRDYVSYATEIKNAGWATSLKYTQNIINKVQSLNLTVYDSPDTIPKTTYQIGKTYTLQANLYIRDAANGEKIDWFSITKNAQLNAYTDDEGFSILRKGTRVTCKSIVEKNGQTWMQIPSGYVCAINSNGKIYIS